MKHNIKGLDHFQARGINMDELELRQKNERFIKQMSEHDPVFFDKLKQGQAPEFFVLSCSDSRVSPSVITQMPLGYMFVHRNIANQVDMDDHSFTASLYFALKHLRVKKIMIQGHTGCGGIKAACEENEEKELRLWLANLKKSIRALGNEKHSLDDLSKRNVLDQIQHLKEHPVYQKYGQNIEIIGSLFHIESGQLEILTHGKEMKV